MLRCVRVIGADGRVKEVMGQEACVEEVIQGYIQRMMGTDRVWNR